ncbi:MAG: ABC transporter ATP-binding protein [Flavobacteriales bacterium]|nr:ABC transporter ATP-binding protein [Flavobacteriales bacterium]
MIRVENINKSFGDKHVLNNLSAHFSAGKINLIIGKSGSGKTMAIKCMLGLHPIDSGSIIFNDRDFINISDRQRKEIRKEIGMVFQGSALFDSMNIQENVMFPLKMTKSMSVSDMKKRVDFCLNRVDLKNVHTLFPSELSGGMQKRVAIARAIVLNPKYLFCDEPNSGLDPVTSKVIDDLLKEITYEYGITTVINTHDMNSVIEIGDSIVFIQDGKKEWEGDKKSITTANNKYLNEFIAPSKSLRRFSG